MELLTNEIKKILPKLNETEMTKLKEKTVICKFFNPTGRGNWYAIEGENEGDDFLFFGFVSIFGDDCDEFGYFSLNELKSIQLPFGLGIERDIHFSPKKITDIKEINLGRY